MFKGLLTGGFFGLLIGGVGVVVASLAAQQPAGNTPPAPPQVDVADAGDGPVVAETAPQEPSVVADETTLESVPLVVAPLAEPSAPIADTEPLALPQTAAVEGALDAPAPLSLPDIAADAEAPVLPNPQSVAPQIPESEGDIVISTTPAAPIPAEEPIVVVEDAVEPDAPEVVIAEVTEAPAPEAVDATEPEDVAVAATSEPAPMPVEVADVVEETIVAAPVPAAQEAEETAAVTPEDTQDVAAEAAEVAAVEDRVTIVPVDDTPAVAVAETAADIATADVAAEPEAVTPKAEAQPAVAPEIAEAEGVDVATPVTNVAEAVVGAEVAEPVPEVAVSAEPAADDANTVTPQVVTAPVIAPDTPATPEATTEPVVVSIIDRDEPRSLPTGTTGVRINRGLSSDEAPAEPQVEAPPVDPNAPAITRFAATYDNPEGKPLMAIVLLDDGAAPASDAALAALPFGVTVALDPTLPDAADRMTAYRAAGLEVAMQAALPAGATPTDVEVALQAGFDLLPETAMLIDAGTGAAPTSSAVTTQIVAALADQGLGYVTASKGLNTGLRAADAAGVPASTVFRDLDNDGQDARVIRRFMDQAAFRARNGGGVVLMGRVRPETLDALAQWGDANRAGQVAMVPVTAVLTAE